ncbi:tRNA (adenosine(37)-N6)-threonylcarbamoyltransferase complex dimerization subunit type 1 TsaB [Stratiformator vulcanicus]|uniref:tRNA threonylcarbamoyladenosine biosynthesis protein TsaB n=1 Tax=Stratiformator vulcanicus TaxID=2527980 RepID=A0A517R1U6_9PLAN|nr:tRNA (adenosine(37)-N6)-threonylcarbamoyltransferase complex dimerization subunit type 1 TsaB [Stratiformator vulcanicus]QDT37831.1 tRNA threonylcarbamoyladenosine biosynthesis protein TsaB [Stratiformator vulcanicus]
MIVLGIETSVRPGSLALMSDGQLLEERLIEREGRRQAQAIVSEAKALTLAHGYSLNEVGLIGVSHGPGSFTGLRVGITFAKTLAYAIGCRLVAVATPEVIAHQSRCDETQCVVMIDAQRGDVFAQRFEKIDSMWRATSPMRVLSANQVLSDVAEDGGSILLTGPGRPRGDATKPDTGFQVADDVQAVPMAATVARLSIDTQRNCDACDPFELEPLYVRVSAAEEKNPA